MDRIRNACRRNLTLLKPGQKLPDALRLGSRRFCDGSPVGCATSPRHTASPMLPISDRMLPNLARQRCEGDLTRTHRVPRRHQELRGDLRGDEPFEIGRAIERRYRPTWEAAPRRSDAFETGESPSELRRITRR